MRKGGRARSWQRNVTRQQMICMIYFFPLHDLDFSGQRYSWSVWSTAHAAGWEPNIPLVYTARFPRLDLHYTNPSEHLIAAGQYSARIYGKISSAGSAPYRSFRHLKAAGQHLHDLDRYLIPGGDLSVGRLQQQFHLFWPTIPRNFQVIGRRQ